jgi:hypothetical protein
MPPIASYPKEQVLEHITFFSDFLQEVNKNNLFKDYKINREIDVYNFIYENENSVVKDINLFLNDEKPLEETSKAIIEIFVKLIVNGNATFILSYPPRLTSLNFSKTFVVYYLFLLETCNANLFLPYGEISGDTIEMIAEHIVFEEIDLIDNEGIMFDCHRYIMEDIFRSLREPVYNYLTRMNTMMQNTTEQKAVEAISVREKLGEDVQGIIGDFARTPVKGGRKTRRKGRAKGRTTRRTKR